jgi:DNA repair exonuclease SbcCD ATPase subunit
VSGLDELSREELITLVLKLHERVQAQQMENAELKAILQRQAERIAELEEEIGRLRGGRSSTLNIKPSVKKEKGPCKRRSQSFARKCVSPTQVVYHALESCPECGRKLSGGTVKWRHQVIEVPRVKVEVTDQLRVES